ncbi:hypothetical protein [Cohnella hongkongensis]|uniref:Uncharacterized protein n=1 Tax=Cohnella hongkongensis TaxID=178337 RepID=A0ABV9FCJ8_9BACL
MSKLHGNERWKSKMLLTEHQEQYENRGGQTLKGRVTPEELTMIRDSIMYPHMLTMCDKSLQEVRRTPNLFKQPFGEFIEIVMEKISREMFALRREMRGRNIKVFEDEIVDGIIYHRYACRGYEDRFAIVREALRTEIGVRLAKYCADILHPPLKEARPGPGSDS